jgi:ATP-dependent DNA ligase
LHYVCPLPATSCSDLTFHPTGEQWRHEIEFDGWRIQLHRHGGSKALFTINSHDKAGQTFAFA